MHLMIFATSFVSFFVVVQCALNPIPAGTTALSSLTQCIANAGKKIFKDGEIILVAMADNNSSQLTTIQLDHLLFQELFKQLRLSIVIKQTTIPSNYEDELLKGISSYIILVQDLPQLSKDLHVLEQYSSWNPHAKFLVISINKFNNNKAVAAYFAEQLWNHKVTNGVIMLQSSDQEFVYETYSWFPFLDGSCGSTFNTTKLMDRCYFGTFTKRSDWFNYKVPTNLNGCVIKVRAVVWPPYVMFPVTKLPNKEDEYVFDDGVEVLIMNTMSELANFTVVYSMSNVIQNWGIIDDKGNATGAMWYLKTNKVDAAIGSFIASVQTQRHLNMIAYDMPDYLHWWISRAELIPKWSYYLILSPELIALLFFFYILISCCVWMLGSFEPGETRVCKSFSWCCLNAFGSMLNVPITILPKTGKVRSLLILWFLVAMHTNVMYQTSLTSVFAQPVRQKQIDTISEIIENDLKLWLLPVHRRFFTDPSNKDDFEILKRWLDCDDIKVCLLRVVTIKDSVMCSPISVVKYIGKDTYRNQWLLHYNKEPIVTYPLHLLLRKGFPFQELFKNLIYRITAAGFVQYWEKKILNKNSKSVFNFDQTSNVTLENLYVFVLLLVIGYIMGTITLIIEICVFKRMQKKLPYLN